MSQPTECVFCRSNHIWDMGIRIDIDLNGDCHTACHEFQCRLCGCRWQYNSEEVIIDIDYSEAQITYSPGDDMELFKNDG